MFCWRQPDCRRQHLWTEAVWVLIDSKVALKHSNRVDADISQSAGVNMIAGQNVVVPAGTQQALRRLQYGSGEAGMMLAGHLGDPSLRGVLVVILRSPLHEWGKLNVRFITLRTQRDFRQSRLVDT